MIDPAYGLSDPPDTSPAADLARRRRRLRPRGIRARLTLIYSSLFLAGGAILLAVTFVLVSHSLSSGPNGNATTYAPSRALLQQCKEQTEAHTRGKGSVTPVQISNQCKKVFQAGAQAATTAQRDHTKHELVVWSLAGLALLTMASAALGWVMAGRVLRPVRDITGAARRASERHLGERIHLSGPEDELKELADTFDAMLDRLDLAFAAQRQFVANASHELRTPLTSMRTAIDVVLAKPQRTPGQLEATAEKVRRSIDRAERVVDALLVLAVSNQGVGDVGPVDLATVAEDALDAVADRVRQLGLRAQAELAHVAVTGNRILLERLIANLVENAVVHNERGGWVRVRTDTDGDRALVEVANGGPSVPADVLPHLFEPFRRGEGRTGSSGVGLGLSIVQSVAERHGAVVEARAGDQGGLTVRVTLPTRPGASETRAAHSEGPAGPAPPPATVGVSEGPAAGREPA